MTRTIIRTYFFSNNEVNEALVQWMQAKDIPTPEYVGNAGTTRWTKTLSGVEVEWTEKDEVKL